MIVEISFFKIFVSIMLIWIWDRIARVYKLIEKYINESNR